MGTLAKKTKKLNPKQDRFCQEYVIDLNASQAAVRAGYSKRNPDVISDNLRKIPHVKARIAELQAKIGEKLEVDAAWITARFKAISDRCMEAEPVMVDGIPTGEYVFDSSGANKSTEMLAKRIGYFEKHNDQKVVKIKIGYGGK